MYTFKTVDNILKINSFVMAIDTYKTKDFVFAGELHDFWEVVYVKSGSVIAAGDERIYHLEKGHILFHKPLEFHRLRSAKDTTPHLLILSFCAHGEGMDAFNERHIHLFDEEQRQFETVFSYCREVIKAYDDSSDSLSFKSHYAANMLELFLLDISSKNQSVRTVLSNDEKNYRRIVSIMKEHITENITVTEISKLCDMSVSNMKRVFRLYSEVGIAKYYLQLRLRYSMELLDNGVSAVEVSQRLNFTDVQYFYTVFRREIGMTPGAYQKRSMQKNKATCNT